MKLDCEVIRDLLPLYAEQMASPASTALVEEHLQTCEACRAELEQMRLPVPVQLEPQPDAPLQKIKTTLRRKSFRAGAAAALAALCAVALVFWMGTLSTLVTAEEAEFWTYSKKENGANLCVLEVQGENVRLETVDGFSWGKPDITVRAVRYSVDRAGGFGESVHQHCCLPHSVPDRRMCGRNTVLSGQPAGGTLHRRGESGRHRAVWIWHRGTVRPGF